MKLIPVRDQTFNPTRHRWPWSETMKALCATCQDGPEVILDDFCEASHFWNVPNFVGKYQTPWIGFLHNPEAIPFPYACEQSMACLFLRESFHNSLPECKALFVMCEHYKTVAEHLLKLAGVSVPVFNVDYPTDLNCPLFNFGDFVNSRTVIALGFWLRDHRTTLMLKPKVSALLGDSPAVSQILSYYWGDQELPRNDWQTPEKYDKLLASSITLVHHLAESPSNAVVECIVRRTPMIINRTRTNVEYLGSDYPLWFDSVRDIPGLINNNDAILDAYTYLSTIERERFSVDTFVKNVKGCLDGL